MPVSPSTQGSSAGRSKKKPHNTNSRRAQRQKIKQRYAKAREDAQRVGLIPTIPEGAVRQEVVDPVLQGCQQLPEVVRRALTENWNTPDVAKPAIIGSLLEPFFVSDVVLDRDGNQVRVPPNRALLMKLAEVLMSLEQTQHERDNPKNKEKDAATTININVETVEPSNGAKNIDGLVEVVDVGGDNKDGAGVPEAAPVPRQ